MYLILNTHQRFLSLHDQANLGTFHHKAFWHACNLFGIEPLKRKRSCIPFWERGRVQAPLHSSFCYIVKLSPSKLQEHIHFALGNAWTSTLHFTWFGTQCDVASTQHWPHAAQILPNHCTYLAHILPGGFFNWQHAYTGRSHSMHQMLNNTFNI